MARLVSLVSIIAVWIAEWTSVVSLLLMSILVSLQVLLRYVFGHALPWAEEAAVYMMVWMAFIGAAVALKRSEHMALTLFVDRLPPMLERVTRIISHLLIMAFLLLLLFLGLQLAFTISGQRSPALGLNMFWPYLILPLGCLFMAAVMLEKIAYPPKVQKQPAPDV
jgi:TRAP-type C4-dicarboxylate transport system permease small subunit